MPRQSVKQRLKKKLGDKNPNFELNTIGIFKKLLNLWTQHPENESKYLPMIILMYMVSEDQCGKYEFNASLTDLEIDTIYDCLIKTSILAKRGIELPGYSQDQLNLRLLEIADHDPELIRFPPKLN